MVFQGSSTIMRSKRTYVKGALQGYSSSASAGAYPQDGISGSYWYDYQGSDNIDPSGCSIPSSIMGGQGIMISVTPGSGKIYSGTVSYEYQVKLGGGNWTTIATTTATFKTYTVPYGTTTFQARVRALNRYTYRSSDYVSSSTTTVTNNQPPTAPGSIAVTNVIAGQQCTITLTAATDPDGTVASYIYERSVDGSAWQQIANVNSLTQTDTVSGDWGTVAYRAKAVDDDGESGPYVTSETTTVNSGWVIISGPASDMGDKPAPFDFVFSVSVTGQTSVDAIDVTVTLDGENIYTGTPNSGVEVTLPIDTRIMSATEHTIEVAASKTNYTAASAAYTFEIPAVELPDGGISEILENSEGKTVFPLTLARYVIGADGRDVNELLARLLSSAAKTQTGSYVGTGTYGQNNPNSLTFDFEPKFLAVQCHAGKSSSNSSNPEFFYVCGGLAYGSNDAHYGHISTEGKTVSWYYDSNAFWQLNEANTQYNYVAVGKTLPAGSIPVSLETQSYSESDNIVWNFSIPSSTFAREGQTTNVTVTMTRDGDTPNWSTGRTVTYTVTGADGGGTTALLTRPTASDPAPTFNIPISNIRGNVNVVVIKITNVEPVKATT